LRAVAMTGISQRALDCVESRLPSSSNPLSGLNPSSWTSRAAALNETCPAFGVSWSPVHSRHYSARLSWRLSVICGQAQRPPRAGRSHTHSARPTRPLLVRAYPERVRNEITGRQKPSLGSRGCGHGHLTRPNLN
jgi:hypothetical protein